jgi:type VI secretion system protein ImpK
MTPPAVPQSRTNSLALSFQDVITVILRMRYGTQRVADATGFRASIRKMIAAAVQEIRGLGYSDASSHMALYAIIGFLDESVLNSQDPTFADWARRPLQ